MKAALALLLAAPAALAQIAPVPAPDPGTPVTTMRPGVLKIKNSSFPKRRIGSSVEMIDVVTSDAGGYLPGRWPGYGPGGFGSGQARNAGAFRVFAARSHFAYDDPIVYPGQRGRSHLHVFFANTETSGVSTPASIRNCTHSTSGGGTVNCSGYWVPAMLYVCDTLAKMNGVGTPNGLTCDWRRDGEVVDTQDEGLNIYYKGYFGVGESSAVYAGSWSVTHDNQPLPVGFRMIAGNPAGTTPPTNRDLGFACTIDPDHEPFYRFIPGSGISDSASDAAWHNCVDSPGSLPSKRLVMRVPFPACRNNAGDLDSLPSHNAHVAFEEQDPGEPTGSYRCPIGYDTPMPGVTYHVIYPYKPLDWPFWRLSSDRYSTAMPAGYSIHGDWFNGWKQDVMAEWTFNCDVRAMDCHDNVLGPYPQVSSDAGYASPCVPGTGTCTWRVLRNPRTDR